MAGTCRHTEKNVVQMTCNQRSAEVNDMRKSLMLSMIAGLAMCSALPAAAAWDNQVEGRPVFKAGRSTGYVMWHDPAGWHMRVTTRGKAHRFHGSITSSGEVTWFRRVNCENNDVVTKAGGRTIRFDLKAAGGADGIDFRVKGDLLTFKPRVDNRAAAVSQVRLGRNMRRASTIPLVVKRTGQPERAATVRPGGWPAFIKGRPVRKTRRRRGYFIWNDGNTWHLRTGTRGRKHRFYGSITCDGKITWFRGVRLERGDSTARAGARTLRFDFKTTGGEDGVDFRCNGRILTFKLRVDRRAASTGEVFTGRHMRRASAVPLVVVRSKRTAPAKSGLSRTGKWPATVQGNPRFVAGRSLGCFIWHDGQTWRVRYTSRGAPHRFSGTIIANGKIMALKKRMLERGDSVVRLGPERLKINCNVSGLADGLDFKTAGNKVVFNIRMDGRPLAVRNIFLGRRRRHPVSNVVTFRRAGSGVADGRPRRRWIGSWPSSVKGNPSFSPGRALGYFVWNDVSGWHVRITTRGAPHAFSGSVTCSEGIKGFRRVLMETSDRVRITGNRVTWVLKSSGGIDGFDFRTGGDVVRFNLRRDGRPVSVREIHLGRQKSRPSGSVFTIERKR